MTAAGSGWVITLLASFGQTLRNATQRDLIGALGAVGTARVRTLALAEVMFAQVISQRVFKERPSLPETIGMAMIVVAAALLVSGMTG